MHCKIHALCLYLEGKNFLNVHDFYIFMCDDIKVSLVMFCSGGRSDYRGTLRNDGHECVARMPGRQPGLGKSSKGHVQRIRRHFGPMVGFWWLPATDALIDKPRARTG